MIPRFKYMLICNIQPPFTLEVTTGPNSARAINANRAHGRNSARFVYDVVVQFSFPSLVTDPGKKGIIGKLIHSSSCANYIQEKNAMTPNENPRYKTRGKVVTIFG